jgi:hypothetical protein
MHTPSERAAPAAAFAAVLLALAPALLSLAAFGCRSASPPAAPAATAPPAGAPAPQPSTGAPAAAPAPGPADRDGTSCERAIIITATTEPTGIAEENRWIRAHYPGYRKVEQALLNCDGNVKADMIEIVDESGHKVQVYFDIGNFFGKF